VAGGLGWAGPGWRGVKTRTSAYIDVHLIDMPHRRVYHVVHLIGMYLTRRASHKHVSYSGASHTCTSLDMHLVGVYLMGVHLMGSVRNSTSP
jgi:hypothetical protein